MGRYGSALEDFNKALALNHNHAVAYISRGQLYARTGNKGLAALDFQRACELGIKEGCNALP
jgi:Flp pilus assembly protein TadD